MLFTEKIQFATKAKAAEKFEFIYLDFKAMCQ